jgi:MFS transporter, SP family, galactose:H+ symporter
MTTGIPTTPTSGSPLVEVPAAGLCKVRRRGVVITPGSFLFGYDTGVVSGALLFIRCDFGLDALQQGSVVSVLLLGAIVGALLTGRVADRTGRRKTLGYLAVLFVVGIAIAAWATGYWMLLVGRVVMGLGVGGVSATVALERPGAGRRTAGRVNSGRVNPRPGWCTSMLTPSGRGREEVSRDGSGDRW